MNSEQLHRLYGIVAEYPTVDLAHMQRAVERYEAALSDFKVKTDMAAFTHEDQLTEALSDFSDKWLFTHYYDKVDEDAGESDGSDWVWCFTDASGIVDAPLYEELPCNVIQS